MVTVVQCLFGSPSLVVLAACFTVFRGGVVMLCYFVLLFSIRRQLSCGVGVFWDSCRLGMYRSLSSRVLACLAGFGTGEGMAQPVLLPELHHVAAACTECASNALFGPLVEPNKVCISPLKIAIS